MEQIISHLPYIFITFVLVTVLVGAISALKTRGGDLDTAEGYFLASRSLPGVIIAGSLLMTNLSTEQLVGMNGNTWLTNMGPIFWELGAVFPLLALAFWFLPTYLKTGTSTIPGLIEMCYDKSVKTMFTVVVVIMYSILNLPVILYSGALVFEKIFGLSTILGTSQVTTISFLCVIIGLIGGCYAVFGGLKAVVISDTIYCIGFIVSGLTVTALAFTLLGNQTGNGGLLGGIQYVLQNDIVYHKLNSINDWDAPSPQIPWPLIFSGMLFNNLYWWCCNQSIVQRALATRSLAEGQKGAILCGFLKCIGPLYLLVPGVIAFYMPSIQQSMAELASGGTDVVLMDQAYSMLVAEVVPWPLMGFFAAVLLGSILSSFNSILNSAATMFTLDFYRSVINPKASDLKCVKIGQMYSAVTGVIAICVSTQIYRSSSGVATLINSMVQYIATPVICTLCGALLFKKIPVWAPKLITVVHFVAYSAFLIAKPTYEIFGGSSAQIHYLYCMAVLLPVELILMGLCGIFAPRSTPVKLQNISTVDLTPWRFRWPTAILAVALVVLIYVVFSPLVLASPGDPVVHESIASFLQ
ncbi:MAG: solute:sodium symporter family transporter [Butyricicoccaceae bacterium]